MASLFLPSSASWLVVLAFICSTLISSRRVDIANSARKLILVGLDFRHRQRRGGFEPPHRQPHGAAMNQRNNDEPEQRRDQKADPEIHDRFDHGTHASNSRAHWNSSGTMPCGRHCGQH